MEGLSFRIVTVIFTIFIQGVLAQSGIGDINGIVAAAVVGFFMLCIVIAMIVLGFMWDTWFTKYQRWRGKIKIPRHIIEQRKKRKQAEKALSEKSLVVANGYGKIPVTTEPDSKSWVEGWHSGSKEYEEKFHSIELGEERNEEENRKEEEYRIEAEIVDNEALDLGPYKKQPDQSLATNVKPDQEDQEAPVYSIVDRSSKKSQTKNNGAVSHTYEETETSFSAMTSDPAVVIM